MGKDNKANWDYFITENERERVLRSYQDLNFLCQRIEKLSNKIEQILERQAELSNRLMEIEKLPIINLLKEGASK